MIGRLNHVAIAVKDLAAATARADAAGTLIDTIKDLEDADFDLDEQTRVVDVLSQKRKLAQEAYAAACAPASGDAANGEKGDGR